MSSRRIVLFFGGFTVLVVFGLLLCVSVISFFYINENQSTQNSPHFDLIKESNFEESVFECSGFCICEVGERRNGQIVRHAGKYILATFSALIALRSAHKHFETDCQTKLKDECETDLIRSEVEDCLLVHQKEETKKLLEEEIDESIKSFTKTVKSIGVVRSPIKKTTDIKVGQHTGWGSAEGIIEIWPQYERALRELEHFDFILMFFIFHKNLDDDKYPLYVHPWRDKSIPKIGLFASRSPFRPNAMGMTKLKLQKIEGTMLYVEGLDVIDGTPVIDIKPYITKKEGVKTGWMRWITDKLDAEGKDYTSLTTDD